MIGYAFCGSFCTISKSITVLSDLVAEGNEVQPIMSETAYSTDTRFGAAKDIVSQVERICKRPVIHTIVDAEPIGPRDYLDMLVIAPCTGNTLAKLAGGITDTAVTMAAKAQMRTGKPVVIALSSNDALSANLANIAKMSVRKNVFFVPMYQDDTEKKPNSLVCDLSELKATMVCAFAGRQIQPFWKAQ
ncbi:MAG: dipicolinate synthase subunit B [Clostridia bacterium]|nr:dipicolinate synthase subunit B [Clostridia bacterium]